MFGSVDSKPTLDLYSMYFEYMDTSAVTPTAKNRRGPSWHVLCYLLACLPNLTCCVVFFISIYTYTHAFMQFLDLSAFRYQEEPAKQ